MNKLVNERDAKLFGKGGNRGDRCFRRDIDEKLLAGNCRKRLALEKIEGNGSEILIEENE
jgi:hypothetical protein